MRIAMSHRIELKPTKIQEARFGPCLGASRFAYNWALADRMHETLRFDG